MSIHPSAIIDPRAKLDPSCEVGPFAVIRGDVTMGKGNKVDSHAIIGSENGKVTIGENNHFHSGSIIGGPPQDLKFKGEVTELRIGNGNIFREFVTVNVGTVTGGGITQIGDQNLLMAYVHIAHDCQLGSHIAIANTSNFAGHVVVEDHVRVGGVCSFNQFIRIGKHSFIAGDSAVNKDILPFTRAQGKYAVSRALNSIGLERAGYSKDEIANLKKAVRLLIMGDRTIEEALKEIETQCAPSEAIQYFTQFIQGSERGVAR
ncbi:MAG: acyl-[acyl-carrier-protein]--UDP-N-acetylglucosamine O-acyltransferase [Bdellovibrionaceae bacterium]|nr:acyl-[acyl-carrier-protein]--UDP-N-acetylglucosamine O-acyltransferase [Pseudobdellovibrionaceae bacterium]|tara:strand:- start:2713 stop:3495 length:783 start_codon:yes stop_codon:yes gene_type:complete